MVSLSASERGDAPPEAGGQRDGARPELLCSPVLRSPARTAITEARRQRRRARPPRNAGDTRMQTSNGPRPRPRLASAPPLFTAPEAYDPRARSSSDAEPTAGRSILCPRLFADRCGARGCVGSGGDGGFRGSRCGRTPRRTTQTDRNAARSRQKELHNSAATQEQAKRTRLSISTRCGRCRPDRVRLRLTSPDALSGSALLPLRPSLQSGQRVFDLAIIRRLSGGDGAARSLSLSRSNLSSL